MSVGSSVPYTRVYEVGLGRDTSQTIRNNTHTNTNFLLNRSRQSIGVLSFCEPETVSQLFRVNSYPFSPSACCPSSTPSFFLTFPFSPPPSFSQFVRELVGVRAHCLSPSLQKPPPHTKAITTTKQSTFARPAHEEEARTRRTRKHRDTPSISIHILSFCTTTFSIPKLPLSLCFTPRQLGIL